MAAKVLFGQSYYLRFDTKLWEEMQPYPPLGTLYAASYIRDKGYEVAMFDAMLADSEHRWAERLDEEQPDYAVIYEDNFNYLSKMCLLRMRKSAFTMIRMARDRDIPVFVCGSDATDRAEQYLNRGADYILKGEGEITLGRLLDHLTEGEPSSPMNIKSLLFKPEGMNEVVKTEDRKNIRDLDQLPFPARDLVDIDHYKRVWEKNHGYFALNMVTTRGCPFHCNWCAKPIWGQRYNARSPENVVEEMVEIKKQYDPDYIWFADDIMGLKPRWMSSFADLLEERDMEIPFQCLNRPDLLLREGDIKSLARAGCDMVWMGAESGSQKVLDSMEKGTKVKQIYQAADKLHDHGIKVGFFIQFGYPGEEWEDIEKTRQLIRSADPDDIGISVSYPLPGTAFYQRVQEQLGAKQNWVDSEDLDMMFQGPYDTQFYRKLHTVVHREFIVRRASKSVYRKVKQSPLRWSRHDVKNLARIVYHSLLFPFDRLRLSQLARIPSDGFKQLPTFLSREEAATPTPQAN